MGRKLGEAVPLLGVAGSSPNSVAMVEANLHTKWHLDPSSRLATTDMGRKLGTAVPPFLGTGSPSNTMWPGPRPTSVPSYILIHSTVSHNTPTLQTDRQSGQDRQRSDSIGRTNRFINGRQEIAPWFWWCSDPDLHVLGNRLRSIFVMCSCKCATRNFTDGRHRL